MPLKLNTEEMFTLKSAFPDCVCNKIIHNPEIMRHKKHWSYLSHLVKRYRLQLELTETGIE